MIQVIKSASLKTARPQNSPSALIWVIWIPKSLWMNLKLKKLIAHVSIKETPE